MPQTTPREPSPSSSRLPQITARVTSMFARLLGVDATRLERDRSFLLQGADSLLLMQASRTLENTFGVRVPFRQLLEQLATIDALAAHLDREMAPTVAPTNDAPVPAVEVAPVPRSDALVIAAPPEEADEASGIPETSDVSEIVARQLALMQAQLELLRGALPRAEPAASERGASPRPVLVA